MLNVAAGKAPMQSSVADGGIPQKAIDGSTSTFFDSDTCSLTEVSQLILHYLPIQHYLLSGINLSNESLQVERAPWWHVNLLEPYMVQLVRIDFGQSCCGKLMQLLHLYSINHICKRLVLLHNKLNYVLRAIQPRVVRRRSWCGWGTTGPTSG